MREFIDRSLVAAVILIMAIVVLGTCSKAHAQSIGLEVKTSAAGSSQLGNIYAEALNKKGNTGLFFWGLGDSGGFAELYAGPTWYPTKWFEVQFGAGVENSPGFWRVGGGAYLIDHHGNGLILWENGASGYWYKATYSYPVYHKVSVGVFSRRFAGTGPLVEVRASKSYMVWATAGPDLQDGNRLKAVIGLSITAK